MLISADVGGTHTRFGLFEAHTDRPRAVLSRDYATKDFASFEDALTAFEREAGLTRVAAAAIGVAGPVVRQRASLTNVPWEVSRDQVAAHLGITTVRLLNDLEAMAWAVEALHPDELVTLQEGDPDREGNAALIAAGTGLGEACLVRVDGHLRPLATEAGHADFAARTDRELALVSFLRATEHRVSNEHVLCGPGLMHLHRFTHRDVACEVVRLDDGDGPAQISRSGMEGRCARCVEALGMFVEALGAEAGNLALRCTATAGVYLGGGIAGQILPWLRRPAFLSAFRDKAPMHGLVANMPVHVIVHPDAGLLGAAVVAASLRA
jgi:glucokinase